MILCISKIKVTKKMYRIASLHLLHAHCNNMTKLYILFQSLENTYKHVNHDKINIFSTKQAYHITSALIPLKEILVIP